MDADGDRFLTSDELKMGLRKFLGKYTDLLMMFSLNFTFHFMLIFTVI